jgi:hypothetical protein
MAASSPPVVVRVISHGPGWLTLLVTFLLGAALTLAVQFWVVPRVETRKRREDRWERDVLELGELLTTSLGRCAQEAYVEQSILRTLKRGDPEFDPAKVAKGMTGRTRSTLRRHRGPAARRARSSSSGSPRTAPARAQRPAPAAVRLALPSQIQS